MDAAFITRGSAQPAFPFQLANFVLEGSREGILVDWFFGKFSFKGIKTERLQRLNNSFGIGLDSMQLIPDSSNLLRILLIFQFVEFIFGKVDTCRIVFGLMYVIDTKFHGILLILFFSASVVK